MAASCKRRLARDALAQAPRARVPRCAAQGAVDRAARGRGGSGGTAPGLARRGHRAGRARRSRGIPGRARRQSRRPPLRRARHGRARPQVGRGLRRGRRAVRDRQHVPAGRPARGQVRRIPAPRPDRRDQSLPRIDLPHERGRDAARFGAPRSGVLRGAVQHRLLGLGARAVSGCVAAFVRLLRRDMGAVALHRAVRRRSRAVPGRAHAARRRFLGDATAAAAALRIARAQAALPLLFRFHLLRRAQESLRGARGVPRRLPRSGTGERRPRDQAERHGAASRRLCALPRCARGSRARGRAARSGHDGSRGA